MQPIRQLSHCVFWMRSSSCGPAQYIVYASE